jgi:hypothetical protein
MSTNQDRQKDAAVEKPAHNRDNEIGAPQGTVAGRAPAPAPRPEADPSSPGAQADRTQAEDRKCS